MQRRKLIALLGGGAQTGHSEPAARQGQHNEELIGLSDDDLVQLASRGTI
jgi:hypothetical protein